MVVEILIPMEVGVAFSLIIIGLSVITPKRAFITGCRLLYAQFSIVKSGQ